MKPYLVSLAVGLLVGVIYAVLKVKSPAPPVIALVGLFGMLVGEQAVAQSVPLAGRLIARVSASGAVSASGTSVAVSDSGQAASKEEAGQ